MTVETGSAREHWSSKLGFLFAAVGSAVGLGVLWKFPYTVGQNGGGLFLFAYIICTMIIGLPVFIGELLMGRRTQLASVGAFKGVNKGGSFWNVGGWLGMISSFLIMSFYSVIAGWGMSYVLSSITGFERTLTAQETAGVFITLQKSGDICLVWHLIFSMISMLIVMSGVRKGIEYWSRIMTRSLFVMLFALALFSMSLPGFGQAVEFIFYPNLDAFKFSSILEALGLSFFTLSLGQGIMFSYGSYMKKTDNVPWMGMVVSIAVILVALLAAMTVFPVVFTYGFEPAAGTGLIFQTMPYLFKLLPGGQIIAIVFFVLFVFTAITSSVAFVEVVSGNVTEQFGLKRRSSTMIVSALMFLVGIPAAFAASRGIFYDWVDVYGTNFLDTLDRLVSVWIIPIGGLITALFIGWVWDKGDSKKEFLSGCKVAWLWNLWFFFMRWVIPVLILLIILQKSGLVDFDALMAIQKR